MAIHHIKENTIIHKIINCTKYMQNADISNIVPKCAISAKC